MVTVKIHGGLGNQMFQYAMGRALSLRLGAELRVDPSALFDITPWKHFVFRNYGLPIVFPIQPRMNLAARFGERVRIPYFAKAFNKYYPPLLGAVGYWKYIEDKNGYAFDPVVFNAKGNIYLNGHWQSEKYFLDQEAAIRKDFSFPMPLRGETKALAEKISASNAVSLFVRRKEVVSDPFLRSRYYVATPDFYARAVALMMEKAGKKPVFYISSDEIDWCRENFKIDAEHVFVGDEHNGPECRDALRLMALCKHFVIPNSSFAWWAAWLSTNKEKVVIAPKYWTVDKNVAMDDALPASWIKL